MRGVLLPVEVHVSKVNRSAHAVTPPPRTEREGRCVQDAHAAEEVRTLDRSVIPLEPTIVRTERASTALPPLGPMGASRVLTADLLNTALAERWESGEEWASNRCIAERYCKITESVVRRWRDGEKAIPLAALHVLPAPLAEQLARAVLRARGVTLRQAMGTLRGAVDNIDAPVAPEDRDEVMRALIDAPAPDRGAHRAARDRGPMIFFAHRCGAALRDGQPEASPFCARAQSCGREVPS